MKLFKNKLVIGIIVFILAGGGYGVYYFQTSQKKPLQYITAPVEKGTVIRSVSGTGQVSTLGQIDVKAEGSGTVLSVDAKMGQELKKGDALVHLDQRDAAKGVRDAKASLTSAEIALRKLKQPADTLSILQAQNSLNQAKDTLNKLTSSQVQDLADSVAAVASAQNALSQANDSLATLGNTHDTDRQKQLDAKAKAEDDLAKGYDNAFNVISNTYLGLPGIMTGLNDILSGYGFSSAQVNLDWYYNQTSSSSTSLLQSRNDVDGAYQAARKSYDASFARYKGASRGSSNDVIDSLLDDTYTTTKKIADTVKTTDNFLSAVQDVMQQRSFSIPSLMRTHQASIASYTTTTNARVTDLAAAQQTLKTAKDAALVARRALAEMDRSDPLEIASQKRTILDKQASLDSAQRALDAMKKNQPVEFATAQQTVKEKEESLAKLKRGADSLDIQSQQLTIQERQNAVQDAEEKLAKTTVIMPSDGVVAKIAVQNAEDVASGATVATVIAKQRLAEISLNEVDVSKVAMGQKTTLTFDALDGLSITGTVAEIDTIGTVTQGVVSYTVKIVFDTQDDRVRPGMSVSAIIITDVHTDVLMVPGAAVKNATVELFDGTTPHTQNVMLGLSNDTVTEIVSGLKEGDVVVTQTIDPNQKAKTTTPTSSFPGLGAPAGRGATGGGQIRTGGAPTGR